MQRVRRSGVRGRDRFGERRPLRSMAMCEWLVAGQGAPVDSLVRKLIPLR